MEATHINASSSPSTTNSSASATATASVTPRAAAATTASINTSTPTSSAAAVGKLNTDSQPPVSCYDETNNVDAAYAPAPTTIPTSVAVETSTETSDVHLAEKAASYSFPAVVDAGFHPSLLSTANETNAAPVQHDATPDLPLTTTTVNNRRRRRHFECESCFVLTTQCNE
jgi:hypothetical protein